MLCLGPSMSCTRSSVETDMSFVWYEQVEVRDAGSIVVDG